MPLKYFPTFELGNIIAHTTVQKLQRHAQLVITLTERCKKHSTPLKLCGRLDKKIIKIYCMKSKLIDVSVCMCICMCVCMYICMYVYMYVCMYVLCVCMYVCIIYAVNIILVLPGNLGQAFHPPLYLNGANHVAPIQGIPPIPLIEGLMVI